MHLLCTCRDLNIEIHFRTVRKYVYFYYIVRPRHYFEVLYSMSKNLPMLKKRRFLVYPFFYSKYILVHKLVMWNERRKTGSVKENVS
jgi:hypothetical protein